MTREYKQLLIKDLSARLPYGVKFTLSDNIYTMKGIDLIVTDEGDWEYAVTAKGIEPIEIEYIKPYLRPISSMTGEEVKQLNSILPYSMSFAYTTKGELIIYTDSEYDGDHDFGCFVDIEDWLNAHHFDYRGLIEKGLAIEAKEGMYKTE